jgi:hypothetical protein
MNAIGRVAGDYEVRVVQSAAEGGVLLENGEFAKVALSCVVRPEPGDSVAALRAGGLWVTCVLTRDSDAPLCLLAPGDLEIAAAGALSLKAGALNVQAGKARFLLDEVMHFGRMVTVQLAGAKIFGGVLETVAERVLLRARHSYRVVDELDHVRCGTSDHKAEGVMHMQAENTFITADNMVRMNAGQIHMG